jgi:TorA maturation chaperone TorD
MTTGERVRVYGLLAEAFCSAPTEESVREVAQVARALGIPCPHELPLDEVRREFMDVFVVPNPRYAAPYESVYRDEWIVPTASGADAPRTARRLLMGESTLAVRQSFVEAGIMPSQDLPDHIGNELRLVAHLWHVEARAGAHDGMEAARQRVRFVVEHPLKWIGELGDKIAESGGSGYYRAAIEVAHTLLRAESGAVPP